MGDRRVATFKYEMGPNSPTLTDSSIQGFNHETSSLQGLQVQTLNPDVIFRQGLQV
jgi:hypothetical protein